MTQMPSFAMQEMPAELSQQPAPAPEATAYRIPRTGQRPLAFDGSELCMAMSFIPGCAYWYEINIYRTTQQKFVVAVRQFFQSETERDRVRAWECDGFAEVLDSLEAYDAAQDVRLSEAHPGDSPAELAGEAMMLKARVAAARAQYGGLVGEILHELEQGG